MTVVPNLRRAVVLSKCVLETLEMRQLMAATLPVTIDFLPVGSEVAGGTLPDVGSIYADRGNGYTYGWNIDTTANGIERNSSYQPYQRSDTLIQMQKDGNRSWEIALDPANYKITLGVGDPEAWGVTQKINAEGISLVNATPTSTSRLLKVTKTIAVTDGKLTIDNAAGATDNKVLYITIEYAGAVVTPTPTPTAAGSISGFTFNDDNRNGVLDSGEAKTSGKKVFLDLDGDNILDAGEKTVTSDASGAYSFTGLAAGEYHVRRVFPSGYTYSNEPINVLLADGQVVSGANIGSVTTTSPTPTPTPTPATNAIDWVKGVSMPTPRVEPVAATVGNRLYVFSGYADSSWQPIKRVDRYNPDTQTWERLADMPVGTTHAGVAVVGTQIWMVGGYMARAGTTDKQDQAVTQVLIYDTIANSYSYGPALPAQRASGGLALIDGKLYYTSGHDRSLKDRTESWVLDLANLGAGWKTFAAIPQGRSHFGTVTYNGQMYVLAGQTGIDDFSVMLKTSYRYNPATNAWTKLADLDVARSHASPNTIVIGTKAYLIGGEYSHNIDTNTVAVYDLEQNKWSYATSLPAKRASGAAAFLNGKIVFTGGKNNWWYADTWTGTFI